MHPLVFILGSAGLAWWATRNREPSAFISFSADDARIRDLFVGQSKHPNASWGFRDRSLHEPFSSAWKTQTKEIISDSDVLIVLVGSNTHEAEGVKWEVSTAKRLGIPIFGVKINKTSKARKPGCLRGETLILWTQDGITEQLEAALE